MTETFRVLVTGSRDWTDHDLVRDALVQARWDAADLPMVVVHGACPSGADAIAAWWCRQFDHLDITQEPHPADWDQYGKRVRNAEMVALGAELCLAFALTCTKAMCRKPKPHDSHGTTHCADLAKRSGITVRRFPLAALDQPQEPTP